MHQRLMMSNVFSIILLSHCYHLHARFFPVRSPCQSLKNYMWRMFQLHPMTWFSMNSIILSADASVCYRFFLFVCSLIPFYCTSLLCLKTLRCKMTSVHFNFSMCKRFLTFNFLSFIIIKRQCGSMHSMNDTRLEWSVNNVHLN